MFILAALGCDSCSYHRNGTSCYSYVLTRSTFRFHNKTCWQENTHTTVKTHQHIPEYFQIFEVSEPYLTAI